ncbi:30S ribosomal protein S8 [Patescibacteria group bacterium]|nr:30S ribosomal protein S8 [Patescibacteria group bacterium]
MLKRLVGNATQTFFLDLQVASFACKRKSGKEKMPKKKSQEENKNIKNKKDFGMVNYPVGDFLIQIKNAALAKKRDVEVSNTKLIKEVAKVLKKEGILDETSETGGTFSVRLSFRKKEPVILNLKLISKPGLRIYWGVDELSKKRGPSKFILSTPEGILSSKGAIKKRIGGEVICEIW